MTKQPEGPLPVACIVGRPNVGKSSLVNRILGRREAIVEERPGVTRDRRSFFAEWRGRRFELVDTGGLESGASGIGARIADQALVAMEAADVILLVVDARTGATQEDLDVAHRLRKGSQPVLVVVNKVDDPSDVVATSGFHSLGLGEPIPVSALHGTGSGDLLDALVALLPERSQSESGAWGSIALIGRPNVGKSSLLNRILGRERAIVDPAPGTTRDPVDSFIAGPDGRPLRLVDTAGMRREVQIKDPVEYFSLLRSRGTLGRVDAAILVVDAGEGMTGHDQRIAREVIDSGTACIVALNKWDLVSGEPTDLRRAELAFAEGLRFLTWAKVVRTSAVTGRGVKDLIPAAVDAMGSHRRRLPTSVVNRIIREAQAATPHPRTKGRGIKVLYAVQAGVAPPQVVLFANGRLEDSYVRYLERKLRDREPFDGSPIRMQVRVKARG